MKPINNMTPRGQRKTRQLWREKTRRRKAKLASHDMSHTPATLPPSDTEYLPHPHNADGRVLVARRKAAYNRKSKRKLINKQKQFETIP